MSNAPEVTRCRCGAEITSSNIHRHEMTHKRGTLECSTCKIWFTLPHKLRNHREVCERNSVPMTGFGDVGEFSGLQHNATKNYGANPNAKIGTSLQSESKRTTPKEVRQTKSSLASLQLNKFEDENGHVLPKLNQILVQTSTRPMLDEEEEVNEKEDENGQGK